MYYNKTRCEKVEEVNLDEEVREIMTVEQEITLWKNRADKAYDKGLSDGVEQGRAEGEKEMQIEIAKTLRLKNMPLTDISEITGLSLSELDNL